MRIVIVNLVIVSRGVYSMDPFFSGPVPVALPVTVVTTREIVKHLTVSGEPVPLERGGRFVRPMKIVKVGIVISWMVLEVVRTSWIISCPVLRIENASRGVAGI